MGDYTNFYLGSTTVAGDLAGLLFVSLSVAPQRLSGGRSAEQQAIAATGTGTGPGRLTAAAVTSGPPAAPAAAARDTR